MIDHDVLVQAFDEANASSGEFDESAVGGHAAIEATAVDEEIVLAFATGRARAWMAFEGMRPFDVETALAALCLEGFLVGARAGRIEAERESE